MADRVVVAYDYLALAHVLFFFFFFGRPSSSSAVTTNEAARQGQGDEEQILRALRVILRDAGYEAVTASTGEEALDRAAVKQPAAAILDLMLPDLDGVEVANRS